MRKVRPWELSARVGQGGFENDKLGQFPFSSLSLLALNNRSYRQTLGIWLNNK